MIQYYLFIRNNYLVLDTSLRRLLLSLSLVLSLAWRISYLDLPVFKRVEWLLALWLLLLGLCLLFALKGKIMKYYRSRRDLLVFGSNDRMIQLEHRCSWGSFLDLLGVGSIQIAWLRAHWGVYLLYLAILLGCSWLRIIRDEVIWDLSVQTWCVNADIILKVWVLMLSGTNRGEFCWAREEVPYPSSPS